MARSPPRALFLVAAGLSCLGCNVFEAMTREMARAEMRAFRTTAVVLVSVVVLTLAARLATKWLGWWPVLLLAFVNLPVTFAACASAVERAPSAFPYEAAYVAASIVTSWLAADAIAAARGHARVRPAIGAFGLVALGGVFAAYAPRVGGNITDAFAPGGGVGCVRYARGGWACWGLAPVRGEADPPRMRRVDLAEGPKVVFGSDVCALRDDRIECTRQDGGGSAPGISALTTTRDGGLLIVDGGRLFELGERERGQGACRQRRVGPVAALAARYDQRLSTERGCILRPDRTVSCWIDRPLPFLEKAVAGLTLDPLVEDRSRSSWVDCPMFVMRPSHDARAIALGDGHGVLLTEDGKIFSWGNNDAGQLGRRTSDKRDEIPAEVEARGVRFAEVAAGSEATCARSVDGEIFCWGRLPTRSSALPSRIDGFPRADRLFFNGSCACVLSSGVLHCWGGCLRPLRDLDHLREIADDLPGPFGAPHRVDL